MGEIIHFSWIFYYKPSILGYPHVKKSLFISMFQEGSQACSEIVVYPGVNVGNCSKPIPSGYVKIAIENGNL